jgi:uncharacterized Zn-binding protein involved in type VI secretion
MNPPYLPTTHTWNCTNGHETTIEDHGRPQTPGIREAVVRTWGQYRQGEELRCPQCGVRASYNANMAKADVA